MAEEYEKEGAINGLSPREAYWKGKCEGLERALEEMKHVNWHLMTQLMTSRPLVSGAQASLIHIEGIDIISAIFSLISNVIAVFAGISTSQPFVTVMGGIGIACALLGVLTILRSKKVKR